MAREMIDTIVVSVDDLCNLVEQMRDDGFTLARLTLSPAFEEDGELIPASLEAEGIYDSDRAGSCVYDSIDAVDID